MLKVVSVEQIRELDRKTIQEGHVSGFVLMDRAGKGLAELIIQRTKSHSKSPGILMFAGKGNNGGDVFAASYYLRKRKIPHDIIVFTPKSSLKGDALAHLQRLRKHIRYPLCYTEDLKEISRHIQSKKPDIIVDGLLGTGITGRLRTGCRGLIRMINKAGSFIVAVDVPSGMNADTGKGESIQADLTITMGLPKRGMFSSAEGQKKCGRIIVVPLGFPKNIIDKIPSQIFYITRSDIQDFIQRKSVISHKGDYGRPLLIAGSDKYPGALVLCASACLKANAGVITALVSKKLKREILKIIPEVIYEEINDNASISNMLRKGNIAKDCTSAVFGPGLGQKKENLSSLRALLTALPEKPVILDADGLNLLSQKMSLLKKYAYKKCILTPHPGEFSRLSGFSVNEILKDRLKSVQDFSRRFGVTVVLKGYGTLIADPDGRIYINSTGNPAMATAGSGDVLAGILAAFTGFRGRDFLLSVISSVYIHGLAGDICRDEIGDYGVTATDITNRIPQAVNNLLS